MTILGYAQNPFTCERIEDLGGALELAKTRQHEELSKRDGSLCRVQDDSWMALTSVFHSFQ